jgi:hypothetical protein
MFLQHFCTCSQPWETRYSTVHSVEGSQDTQIAEVMQQNAALTRLNMAPTTASSLLPLLLLPQVFCASDSNAHEEMRQACFDYLAKGGQCASGPVSLLSGLNPSPSALVMHFFSVALFGVGRLLQPRPTFRCATGDGTNVRKSAFGVLPTVGGISCCGFPCCAARCELAPYITR